MKPKSNVLLVHFLYIFKNTIWIVAQKVKGIKVEKKCG